MKLVERGAEDAEVAGKMPVIPEDVEGMRETLVDVHGVECDKSEAACVVGLVSAVQGASKRTLDEVVKGLLRRGGDSKSKAVMRRSGVGWMW